jgi:hypothetical protein
VIDGREGFVCDMGATAAATNGGGVDDDMTASLLALPSTMDARECVMRSCSEYLFAPSGLSRAGIDTSAPVGSLLVVQFVVVDNEGRLASVNRTVAILPPPRCAADEFRCGPSNGEESRSSCSPVPCHILAQLLGPDPSQRPPAVLQLLAPPNYSADPADVTVEYGSPLGWSLLPCEPGAEERPSTNCGAVALRGDGSGYIEDSVDITVRPSVPASMPPHSSRHSQALESFIMADKYCSLATSFAH